MKQGKAPAEKDTDKNCFKSQKVIWINCIKVLSIILIILSSTFCKKEEDNTEIGYRFPFNTGLQWTYNRIQNVHNVTPNHDSITDIHDTIIIKEINIEIFKNDSTEGSILRAQHIGPNSTTGYYNYYKETCTGLYRDYEFSGGLQVMNLFPCRNDYYFCGGLFHKDQTISLTFDETILKYPLEIGKEWIVSPSGELRKRVTGKEIVQFNGANYDCFKIEYFFESDANATTTDYISEIGLLKRIRFIPNISIDGKGKGDYLETFELIAIQLIK